MANNRYLSYILCIIKFNVSKRSSRKNSSKKRIIKKRSRISIISELYTNPKMVLNVSPGSFVPRPKVNSALVYFEILKKPRFDHNQARLKLIIDAAFNQKRKMIRSSLKKFFQM